MKVPSFEKNGLGRRVTRIVVLSLAALIFPGGFFLHAAIKELLISQFDQSLLTKARTLTRFAEPGRTGINLSFTEKSLPEFQSGDDSEYYQLWFKDHSVLARSPSLTEDISLPKRSHQDEPIQFSPLTLPDGRPGRAVSLRLNSEDDIEDEGFIVDLTLARSSERLDQILQKLVISFLLGGAGLLVLAWAVVRRAARSALRPVDTLADQVAKIDAETLSSRIPIGSLPVDLQSMAEQINELVERLGATFARERRFASNAAHELLTPVSELRLAADNALDWPDDPRATRGLAQEACDLAEQMEHVVRSLLALSRAEAQLTPVGSDPVEIDAMIRELLASYQSKITLRDLKPICEFSEKIQITSDRVIIRSILTNLLTNAIDYATDSSPIKISGQNEPESIKLIIKNRSKDVRTEDLEHFCEAFWRRDTAHSSREHAGLGLALSRAFVRLLGGNLSFSIENDEMVVATLNLPTRISARE